jgi:hypothetical protein
MMIKVLPDDTFWRVVNRNPKLKRLFVLWDSLAPIRQKDLMVIGRALIRHDKERAGARK